MDLGGAQNRARLRRKIDYGKGIRGEYLKMNPNFLTPITPTPRSNLRRRRARFWTPPSTSWLLSDILAVKTYMFLVPFRYFW
jgi:hypothetical protein